MTDSQQTKIFHIVHYDRLMSIIRDGFLWCDAEMAARANGTVIGLNHIKQRRLYELRLACYPDLFVGQCVPFYFCPRSVMLYLIHKNNNPELNYHGGQEPIVHLVADLHETVNWAAQNQLRWVFTLSNAGSKYFEDRNDLNQLHEINWSAVNSRAWQSCREEKQAEFLLERCFPWNLIKGIGVYSDIQYGEVSRLLPKGIYRPPIKILPQWYY